MTGKEMQAALGSVSMEAKCNVCGEVHLVHSLGMFVNNNPKIWPCVERRLYSGIQLAHKEINLDRFYGDVAMCLVMATVPPGGSLSDGFFLDDEKEINAVRYIAHTCGILLASMHVACTEPVRSFSFRREQVGSQDVSVVDFLGSVSIALSRLMRVIDSHPAERQRADEARYALRDADARRAAHDAAVSAGYGAWFYPFPASLEWALVPEAVEADRAIASRYLATLLSPKTWDQIRDKAMLLFEYNDGDGYCLKSFVLGLCAFASNLRDEVKAKGLWDSQLSPD